MKNNNEMIGKKFGRLTVVNPAEPDKNGKKKWNCKCECGNFKIIFHQSLNSGATKSCGCLNKESTSKRMSRGWSKILTKDFLQKEHIENKKSLRKIAKEIGCTVSCVMKYMKSNNLISNDCFLDIKGKKFGKLTIVDMAYTKNTNSYWNTICDCGTKKIIIGASIVKSQVISCGCWNREKNWKGCGNLSKTYWSRIISHAATRNIEFNITIEFAWKLFEEQKEMCAISGIKLIMERQFATKYTNLCQTQTASLDRIDSTKGYSVDNVQWVHFIVNRMKSNLQQNEFFEWCNLISKNKKPIL